MATRIYLDHASTTPVAAEVLEAMLPYLGGRFGNASSLHARGQAARDAVDQARAAVAGLVRALPGELLFTASATESNNLALKGVALAPGSAHGPGPPGPGDADGAPVLRAAGNRGSAGGSWCSTRRAHRRGHAGGGPEGRHRGGCDRRRFRGGGASGGEGHEPARVTRQHPGRTSAAGPHDTA